MTVESGYPVMLVHPQHQPAKIVEAGSIEPSAPERFPSVTVNGAAQEAQYRALGYLRFGEPAPMKTDHHEFPKTLRHPDYEPEIPSRVEMRIENGRALGTYTIPAVPAVMPDVIVLNEDQEAKAREAGYKPAGEYNRGALEAVLTGTIDQEEYAPDEYPKWVDTGTVDKDGKPVLALVERDPNAPEDLADPKQFPKLVNGKIVADPNVPVPPDPHEFPKWVHRDGIPSEASALANNPIEEAAIRARWAPKKEVVQNSEPGRVVRPDKTSALVKAGADSPIEARA